MEVWLSAEERPGNWLPMREGTAMLIVRQNFLDRSSERPARLTIERVEGPEAPRPLEATSLAAGLERAASYVTGTAELFARWAEGFVERSNELIAMDPDAPSLEDYIGDFKFYLDYYTRQSPSGIELRGPQRWRVKANWKIGAENFAGDMYHTPQTHTSVVEIGLFREPKAEKRKDGNTYWAGNGGGTTYKLPPGTLEERLRYVGYPDEMVERMKATWSQEQLDVIGRDGFMISAASLFPNMSFVHNWPKVEEGSDEDVLPFISIRTWLPISEDETEVYSWFAVDAEAPEEFKALSYKAYLMCFGSTGMFEQDDVENWVSLTNTAKGSMARRLLLNSRMGILKDGSPVVEPLGPDQFAGPGVAHVGYGEYNQRHLLHRWADYLESEYEGVDFRALSIGGEPPLDVEPRPAGITNNGQKVVR